LPKLTDEAFSRFNRAMAANAKEEKVTYL